MTIKPAIQTGVILASVAGVWLSLSTSLRTNLDATSSLIKNIDKSRQQQSELYKQSEDQSITRILSLLDRTQQSIRDGVDQNLTLTQNVLGIAKSVDEVSKQNQALAEQNKMLTEEMAIVLTEHTKSLQEAKTTSKEAEIAARNARVDTRKALKAISKPTPRPWFHFP